MRLLRAGCLSCIFHLCGDAIAQGIEKRQGFEVKEYMDNFDFQRFFKFGLVGFALHGPFFATGFKLLDQLFSKTKLSMVSLAFGKSIVGQFTIMPLYLCIFYPTMGLLEGRSIHASMEKLQKAFIPTFITGSIWIPVNLVNFSIIPPGAPRIVTINVVGIFWQSFLSFENRKVALQVSN